MKLQSTLGAFLVAFTMVNGSPVLPENDQNSRGITAPFNPYAERHLDNLPNKPMDNIPKGRKYPPEHKEGPSDNPNPLDEQLKMTPEEKEQSEKWLEQYKARGPRKSGSHLRTGGAPAAPPSKRSPRRGRVRGGWKGKDPDPRNGDVSDRRKGADSHKKKDDDDSRNPWEDGTRRQVLDGIAESDLNPVRLAVEEFNTEAAPNEKRKVPVPDADKKNKKFDDFKARLDRIDEKDLKPSWRMKHPCGGPACLQNDNPVMNIDTIPLEVPELPQ